MFKNTESGEEAIDSEGVFAEGGGDLVLSEGTGEVECGVADCAEYVRAVAFADTTMVLAPCDITWPMDAIFDAPVAAPPGQQLGCVGLVSRHAGNRIDDFRGLPIPTLRGAFQAADLRHARPVQMADQTRRSL